MKLNLLLICSFLTFLIIGSCSFSQDKQTEISIVSLIPTEVQDSSWFFSSQFIKNTPHSVMGGFISHNICNNIFYTILISNNLDTIYVADNENHEIRKIPLNGYSKKNILQSVYFQNLDSIFLINDRFSYAKFQKYNLKYTDISLLNSKGEILENYVLDSVPFIFTSSVDTMVYLNRVLNLNFSKRVLGDELLLPLSIYNPSPNDFQFDFLSLLASLNLKSKRITTYPIHLPKECEKINYPQNVCKRGFDFNPLNNTTILISYYYSPSVYSFDLRTNKLKQLSNYENYPFQNMIGDTSENSQEISFFAPEFIPSNQLFIRRIKFRNYKNFHPFEITEILDTNFQHVGFSYPENGLSSIRKNWDDKLICFDENFVAHYCEISQETILRLNSIENNYLQKFREKEVNEITPNYLIETSFEQRMRDYVTALELPVKNKVVFVFTENMCIHCIEFLLGKLKENSNSKQFKNVTFVFYGSDFASIISVLNAYSVNFENNVVVLDGEFLYQKYFQNKDLFGEPFFIDFSKTPLFKMQYTPESLPVIFKEFIQE